ncbi:MAG TPA: hypothetical protein VNX68_16595, partial [Nitrosopumilaceae archaeon]|nr:hypothetical protein [Nitrosopumilaceae archaeon]
SQYQGIKRSTVISNSTLMGNEAGPDATDKKVVQENDKKKLANSSFISAKSIDSIGSSLSGENENSPYNMVSNTESHDAMKNTSTPEEYGQNHQSLSNGTIPNSRSNDTIISKSIIGVSAEIGDTTKKQSGLNTNGKCMKISLEAGANALNNSVSPIIGVLALKPFSERWGGGIGLVYTYLKLPDNAGVRTFTTQSTCDFGYSANITEIRIDKLHYAIIPIFITANLNKTNSVQLGANVFFLFNSSGTISSYHEDYSGKQPSVSRKVNGYLNGFSAYDIGLSAGYRKQILCNIGAGAYLNYGLINIAKTEYYNAGAIGKNISMQLQLTYIIHK